MRCLKAVALAFATSIFAPSIVAAPTNVHGYNDIEVVNKIGEEIVHAAGVGVETAPQDLRATCSVTLTANSGARYDILVPEPAESCAKVQEALTFEMRKLRHYSCGSTEKRDTTHITFNSSYWESRVVRKIDEAYGGSIFESAYGISQACHSALFSNPVWSGNVDIRRDPPTVMQTDGVMSSKGHNGEPLFLTADIDMKHDETSILPRDAFLGGKPNGFFDGIPMLSNVAINCIAHSLRYNGLTKIRTYDTWIRALSDTHCLYTMQLLSGVPGISNIFCSGYDTHENTHITFDIPDEDILEACGAMNDAYVPGPSHANQTLDICLVMKAAWSDQWQFAEDNDG